MLVDHEAVRVALERVDGAVPGNPKVTVHLSEPDENGVAELTISGSAHASEESVIIALGILPQPEIKKYTPSPVGFVVNEPARPPSPAAASASIQPKGRIVQEREPRRPAEQANLVEANPAPKPGRARKERKK
jgi:hypothetical protein